MKTLIPQKMTDQELEESLREDPFHEYRLREYDRRQVARLKQAVDRLAHPKWIEWAILIVTALAFLVGLIALVRAW